MIDLNSLLIVVFCACLFFGIVIILASITIVPNRDLDPEYALSIANNVGLLLYLGRAAFVATYVIGLLLIELYALTNYVVVLSVLVSALSALVISFNYNFLLRTIQIFIWVRDMGFRLDKGESNSLSGGKNVFEHEEMRSQSSYLAVFLTFSLFIFGSLGPIFYISNVAVGHLTAISLASVFNFVGSLIYFSTADLMLKKVAVFGDYEIKKKYLWVIRSSIIVSILLCTLTVKM